MTQENEDRSKSNYFSPKVCEKLKYYVYRLIDPRNGETFYVGKGTRNRLFEHAAGKLEVAEEADEPSSIKLQRIRDIQLAGMEVQHIVHRHGMDPKTALEVEAALIDAYPGLTNVAGGHHNLDRGVMHAETIIEKFEAPIAVIDDPAIIIKINRSARSLNTYDATRICWAVSPSRAKEAQYVLAVHNGLIVDVFEPEDWLLATDEDFRGFDLPSKTEYDSGEKRKRYAFYGPQASERILKKYVRHRIPQEYRKKGQAGPFLYCNC